MRMNHYELLNRQNLNGAEMTKFQLEFPLISQVKMCMTTKTQSSKTKIQWVDFLIINNI